MGPARRELFARDYPSPRANFEPMDAAFSLRQWKRLAKRSCSTWREGNMPSGVRCKSARCTMPSPEANRSSRSDDCLHVFELGGRTRHRVQFVEGGIGKHLISRTGRSTGARLAECLADASLWPARRGARGNAAACAKNRSPEVPQLFGRQIARINPMEPYLQSLSGHSSALVLVVACVSPCVIRLA